MSNENIEDIFIGNNENNTRKKGKKGIIIIFVILILVLTGMVSAYFYFTTQTLTKKQIFINSISNTNIKKFLENNVFEETSKRMLEENTETETKITFSATKENEELQGIDLSKFELNLTNKNNIENEKSYNELGLNYSGNEIFKAKMLSGENGIAIGSDEIVDKYIGINYDKIKEVFGIEFNKEDIEKFKNSEKIELSQEEKESYMKKYLTNVFEKIEEEKFTTQENIAINKNSQSIDVISYSLELTQEELNNIMVDLLTNLRNDEELLGKLVTGKSKEISNNTTNDDSNVINDEENKSTTNEEFNFESSNTTINLYDETNSSEENLNNMDLNSTVSIDKNITSKSTAIAAITFGRKVEYTVQELQEEIDGLIEEAKQGTGNGLKVNVYVSETATEKISVTFANDNTLDLEFSKNAEDENNNSIQITYLQEKDNSSNEVETYSAEDNNEIKQAEKGTNGFTLLLNKINKDANTTIKANCSIVENEEINQRIEAEIKTNGTATSNSINNDIIIEFKTQEDEYNITLENKINFTTPEIEDLNDDNCLFLENLSEEERNELIKSIMERIAYVYQEKLQNFNLIDSNTNSPVIQQNPVVEITKDKAKEVIIDKVSRMMGEAQNNNEEFTIKNLENLQIEGYEVSTTITEEVAIIVIDTYTFRITPEFELLED